MHLTIITPDKQVLSSKVDVASFPGSDGSFQVLNNHAPLVSSLGKGDITYRSGGSASSIYVEGGVIEVLNNNITVLAEKAS